MGDVRRAEEVNVQIARRRRRECGLGARRRDPRREASAEEQGTRGAAVHRGLADVDVRPVAARMHVRDRLDDGMEDVDAEGEQEPDDETRVMPQSARTLHDST